MDKDISLSLSDLEIVSKYYCHIVTCRVKIQHVSMYIVATYYLHECFQNILLHHNPYSISRAIFIGVSYVHKKIEVMFWFLLSSFLGYESYGPSNLTLSRSITMFCGTDSTLLNILKNNVNPREHCYGSK